MQKPVNCAIGSLMALCAAFAHADAIPTTVQAIHARTKAEVSVQPQAAERQGGMMWAAFERTGGTRAAAAPATPHNSTESPAGMLVGALAIMAVMVRRRWRKRS